MKNSKTSAIKKYFYRFFDVSFILSHALIPLVILTLYSVLLDHFLPKGVNKAFSGEMWKLALSFAVIVNLLAFLLWKFGKGNRLLMGKDKEYLVAWDFVLLLLPLTPVVQYLIHNQDILSPLAVFHVAGIFVIIFTFFIILVPKFLGFWGSERTLAILGMAFTFILTDMAALSRQFAWHELGSLKIQLILFGSVFFVCWILDRLNYRKFLYLWIAVYFLSNCLVQMFTPTESKAGRSDISNSSNKLVELVGNRKPSLTPNIYLLIYDAYAQNETMLSYGIDNSLQEEFLKEKGFKFYPNTYSIAADSIRTMSRVLNASAEYYGNIRRAASGDGVVQNLLKGFGYKTFGLFPCDFFFRGCGSYYDFYFPTTIMPSSHLFTKAIFTGEFLFDLDFGRFPHEQFVEHKLNVFKKPSITPRFIDMHTDLPCHSQNSGICLPNETELYKKRLDQANLEMREDIETLIKNDPGAIMIVASDHSPYLTKNCTKTNRAYSISEISRLDIQDRFGTFLAIRWPSIDFEEYDEIIVLQDLFPSIFSYLFKDKRILEAKVDPVILESHIVSGATVKNGIICGGIHDGKPLFVK
ncbi:MAG TPA: hypothetical protein PK915_12935 [Bacteroidales bacterium]|nr:hypothetical protein [Bacteroidales bacterium]